MLKQYFKKENEDQQMTIIRSFITGLSMGFKVPVKTLQRTGRIMFKSLVQARIMTLTQSSNPL